MGVASMGTAKRVQYPVMRVKFIGETQITRAATSAVQTFIGGMGQNGRYNESFVGKFYYF